MKLPFKKTRDKKSAQEKSSSWRKLRVTRLKRSYQSLPGECNKSAENEGLCRTQSRTPPTKIVPSSQIEVKDVETKGPMAKISQNDSPQTDFDALADVLSEDSQSNDVFHRFICSANRPGKTNEGDNLGNVTDGDGLTKTWNDLTKNMKDYLEESFEKNLTKFSDMTHCSSTNRKNTPNQETNVVIKV
uniref:Uncharacterized protein n=1 Tax=Ditylum brightwellii TaxID=49249 RepID=A0A6S9I812_9STRA|mmetsp:Transcript_46089/g.69516  ORF Transcript_46089/g.69516 Transcript_46089/m.69516 type:complete len:188 (-) Transcript_46089:134-697(-)